VIDFKSIKKIIISRTDSIGDVVLTLPLAGILKNKFPGVEILFLGRAYTRAVIQCCKYVDRFIDWDEFGRLKDEEKRGYFKVLNVDAILHVFPDKEIARLAKRSGVPVRIGTSHRVFHWLTCNYKPDFTRKNSELHEAQLNVKLLAPLGINESYTLEELNSFTGFGNKYALPEKWKNVLDTNRKKIILHPKSKGSAREWSLDHFSQLIDLLPQDKFQLFISGTAEEKIHLKEFLEKNKNKVTDLTGQLSLEEFIAFIDACDGLVAASTGPLHIASLLNKRAIGIYPPMRPIHPGRWKPIGENSIALVADKPCNDCKRSGKCHCVNEITPDTICKLLIN